jgi:hypothetical protein
LKKEKDNIILSTFLKTASSAVITTVLILLSVYVYASFGNNKLGPLFGVSIFFIYFFAITIVATIIVAIIYFSISKKILKPFVFLGTTCALLGIFTIPLSISGDKQNTIFLIFCFLILMLGLGLRRMGYTKLV